MLHVNEINHLDVYKVDVNESVKIRMNKRNFIKICVEGCFVSALVYSGADQSTLSVGMTKFLLKNDCCPMMSSSQFHMFYWPTGGNG